eukprot:GFKZ01003037.1.p1 GENE.GFKZ01003037.1~~GFKZ01003037.1.p1  ORF type:complete len:688 (+),score=101.92 GFKZ01003037.1:72-2135(+)
MNILAFSRLPSRTRIALALLLSTSGLSVTISHFRTLLRRCRAEQQSLVSVALGKNALQKPSKPSSSPRQVVDRRFAARLSSIIRVCIPGPFSNEAALVALQTLFLCSRTLLSNRITYLEGCCASNVTAQNWTRFRRDLARFAVTSIPAAVVNSALKAMQILVSLALRKRLTTFLHKLYLGNRAYYAASVFSGLSHPDQRITDDVEKFCDTMAELYSYTFKPLLDVIVFSRSLSQMIGYKGQIALYTYFVLIGAVLRRMSPPLGRMTAEFSSLSGDLRSAHHRIAASAEEVAFNDPPAGRAEMMALNTRLNRMVRHSRFTVVQRFIQQCFDGYLVKYTASIIGLVIFAVPLYYRNKDRKQEMNEIAGQYVNSVRLMMQTSSAMGELVLVYKRINTLAGHTARVAELVEKVKELGKPQGHLEAFRAIQDRGGAHGTGDGEICAEGEVSVKERILEVSRKFSPKRMYSKDIKLDGVWMWSPEGVPLVKDLTFEVTEGQSVIILGPNGSGKSSILRMMAGLWPLQAGTVGLPARDEVFYLSQRPYMYAGSLKEQLMYPRLAGVVIGEEVKFNEKVGKQCLESVELGHLIGRCGGFDGRLGWEETLSGGERNRLAVARLLYHKPRFAVLDECTAAVSADGEVVLYKAMASAGITLLSVAHRQAVMEFHEAAIVLDGAGGWRFMHLKGGEEEG